MSFTLKCLELFRFSKLFIHLFCLFFFTFYFFLTTKCFKDKLTAPKLSGFKNWPSQYLWQFPNNRTLDTIMTTQICIHHCSSYMYAGLPVTWRVLHVEQELLTIPYHSSLPPVFSGVRVARSFVFCVVFLDHCFLFFFGHCFVCLSSIYGFRFTL